MALLFRADIWEDNWDKLIRHLGIGGFVLVLYNKKQKALKRHMPYKSQSHLWIRQSTPSLDALHNLLLELHVKTISFHYYLSSLWGCVNNNI